MVNDIEAALAAASAATGGLDDFGEPAFREGLGVFLESAEVDGDLNPVGQAAAGAMVHEALVNRLQVNDWHHSHPELASTPVEAPVFLIGLPRTGTTALSHLLSADPANRSLLAWEARESVPPPEAATYRSDPRFVAAMEAPDMIGLLNPEFKAIHHDPPDMPIESAVVLAQSFTSLHLPTMLNIDGYLQWLLTADHGPAYRHHRRVLQVLQSRCPGHWQLKSPVHLVDPGSLAEVYPDARFVLTHRDPVTIASSVCNLVRTLTSTFTDTDGHDYVRATWPELIGTLLDRQSAFRDAQTAAGNGDAFIDLAYRDLVADPIATVGSLYERLDRPFTHDVEAALAAHAAAHPKDKHGAHRYSLEDWDLSRPALEERYADYLQRYAAFLEAP